MFSPSRVEVRGFFCEVRRKEQARQLLTPLEAIAARWIAQHPEYHALLDEPERALAEDYSVERGQSNPFLHLALHLTLDEQVGIDQPSGIRAALAQLAARHGDEHAAAHEAMECLGQILWETQRGTLPTEIAAINVAYLECLRRRMGDSG
jgi:hypothetical protein